MLNAYARNGGSYMLYHVGRVIARDFGVTTIAVMNSEREGRGEFVYDTDMQVIHRAALEREISDDDFLIMGPSFSHRWYGWQLPGFKLCYVQGFSTFRLLDVRLDHFVAVSEFVASFLLAVYGVKANVIPPFVSTECVGGIAAWSDRPPSIILPYVKGFSKLSKLSIAVLKQVFAERAPQVTIDEPIGVKHMPRNDFLAKLGSIRYLVSLSPADGCALVPLEAMALGTLVAGYDGFGSSQYMRPGENCLVAPFPRIERSANMLAEVIRKPSDAEVIAARGKLTANTFAYEAFRAAWLHELETAFALWRRRGH